MYRRNHFSNDRAPPAGDWGDCSRVAKAAIEKNVDEHKLLIAKREKQFLDHVPRLVDLAAERLGKLSTGSLDSLDDVPAVIFESYIWKWHNIPYAAFRRGLPGFSADPGAPILTGAGDIDEWILLNEKWLRDGHHTKWQHGLVTLSQADNVFPNSILNPSSRTITRPESPLPGYELLCAGRLGEPRITIQPSVEAFKRAFEHMSDGLLKNLNWSNVLVAGGIVLGTLLSMDIGSQPRRDPRWKSSDMDVYIYGLSPKEANEKIEHLFKTNTRGPELYNHYLVESPKTVLLNFDLDVCAMGWDGSTLWMLPRAARALEMGCNVFTMSLIRGHYLSDRRASTQERVFKYADKGYGIRVLPSYISSLTTGESTSNNSSSLDFASAAAAQRDWTTKQVGNVKHVVSVQTVLPRDVRYRASRALNDFRVFMRCVSLWEMAHRGLENNIWASTEYEQPAMTDYGAPHLPYNWDTRFNLWGFEKHIRSSNAIEICNWRASDIFGRLGPYSDFCDELEVNQSRYRRIISAPTVDALLSQKNDLMLQVFLPPKFADYASNVVIQAQAQAGLPPTQLLIPIERDSNTGLTRKEGLFFWRIGKDLARSTH
ncbi:hypothetical protein MSAN_02392700 [Mycena sanguinolenta]|uniref:Uncharacterized protein n=1 Tax=Mycena sanguinolenta TaxID=230812 RepID=A0A8H6X551_9AGAR|nr:hypothetical protein MSAN_02392700 [Mycena sanguinolenta]